MEPQRVLIVQQSMRMRLGRRPFAGPFKRAKDRPYLSLWGTWAISLGMLLGVVGWLRVGLVPEPEEWPIESRVAVDKLACLLTSPAARIQVQAWTRSCADTDSFIDLSLGPDAARFSGWSVSGPHTIREVGPTRLSADKGRFQLAGLVAAARRPEIASRCVGALVVARISYWCAEQSGTLLLATHLCDAEEVESIHNFCIPGVWPLVQGKPMCPPDRSIFAPKYTTQSYVRAHGVRTLAGIILDSFPGKEIGAATDSVSRERDALYEAEHQPEPDWLKGESYH